jgi:hypothetical protein
LTQEESISETESKQNWLLSRLFDINTPIPKYVLLAGLISLIPSLVISITLNLLGIMNEETLPEFEGPVVLVAISFILIGPPIETFIMVSILKVLSFITKRTIRLAIMSAIVWAFMHSLAAWAWGLVVVWPFFVFSCSYLSWRKKSFWHAILITSGVHAFQNVLPAIAIIASK